MYLMMLDPSFQLFRTQWLGKGNSQRVSLTGGQSISNYSELNGSVKNFRLILLISFL